MNIIYSREPFNFNSGKTLFLAGPTPRSNKVKSWRPEFIAILYELGFEGNVCVPEDRGEGVQVSCSYFDQIEWEHFGLNNSDVIVFWVPRNLDSMPAFTTNIEFGLYITSGRVIYGRPALAPKNKYLDYLYKKETQLEPHDNMYLLVNALPPKGRSFQPSPKGEGFL